MTEPSYYAIIPATVRYAEIPHGAKLLYGELTALSKKHGYSWASDEYFARLYRTSEKTIRRWLSALEGIDEITISPKVNGERKIFILLDKNVQGIGQKCPDILDKNVQHSIYNNTRENNTLKNGVSRFDDFWKIYPKKKSKGQAEKEWNKKHQRQFLEENADMVINSVKKHMRSFDWKKNDGQFIPYPATFLSGKMWEDEVGQDGGTYEQRMFDKPNDILEPKEEEIEDWGLGK